MIYLYALSPICLSSSLCNQLPIKYLHLNVSGVASSEQWSPGNVACVTQGRVGEDESEVRGAQGWHRMLINQTHFPSDSVHPGCASFLVLP